MLSSRANLRVKMDNRRKTNAFLSSLDEDLLIYKEELKKRGFTLSTTLKYLRAHDLEEMGMADGHKRLLMNAVSKLVSPQQTKDCKPLPSKKRRIPFAVIDDNQAGSTSTSFDDKEDLSDDDTIGKQLNENMPPQVPLKLPWKGFCDTSVITLPNFKAI